MAMGSDPNKKRTKEGISSKTKHCTCVASIQKYYRRLKG
jgi:hypothetical protein